MLKHKEFIEKSKVRVEEIEQKAKERSNIKKTTSERHKMVKFSNPITSSSKQDKCIQPPQRLFASKPEKIPSKEVHQRTERLYSRLPEVEARKKELQRQKDYAKNREKAKDYYEVSLHFHILLYINLVTTKKEENENIISIMFCCDTLAHYNYL
jgi:hypothetical protein